MGDYIVSVLKQQTRLLLHYGEHISLSHNQQCLNLTMHFSLRHLAAKMLSQFYNNIISFPYSFLSYETCSINVNPLFHAAIKTFAKEGSRRRRHGGDERKQAMKSGIMRTQTSLLCSLSVYLLADIFLLLYFRLTTTTTNKFSYMQNQQKNIVFDSFPQSDCSSQADTLRSPYNSLKGVTTQQYE